MYACMCGKTLTFFLAAGSSLTSAASRSFIEGLLFLLRMSGLGSCSSISLSFICKVFSLSEEVE